MYAQDWLWVVLMSTVYDPFPIIFPISHGQKITLSETPYNIKASPPSQETEITAIESKSVCSATKPIIMNPSGGVVRMKST